MVDEFEADLINWFRLYPGNGQDVPNENATIVQTTLQYNYGDVFCCHDPNGPEDFILSIFDNSKSLQTAYVDANGAVTLCLKLTAKAQDVIKYATQRIMIERQGPFQCLGRSWLSDKHLMSCTTVRCAATGRDFTVQNVILSAD